MFTVCAMRPSIAFCAASGLIIAGAGDGGGGVGGAVFNSGTNGETDSKKPVTQSDARAVNAPQMSLQQPLRANTASFAPPPSSSRPACCFRSPLHLAFFRRRERKLELKAQRKQF